MKAVVYKKYGLPDVLHLQEVETPTPKDDEVLISVRVTSINASDWEFLTAKPAYVRMWGFLKPKKAILCSDISGVVEAVGKNVTRFNPGDEVFGDLLYSWGGLAEYLCAKEEALMLKPASMSFEETAALPQASTVALQGLNDAGQIQPGQQVLINGAGGGAGTFAIQLAKLYGASVTGVDNTEKQDLMRLLGADHVVDFTQEDFTENGQHYDLILDLVNHRSIFDYKRALAPEGAYVMVGGSLVRILQVALLGPVISKLTSKKMGMLFHQQNHNDLAHMISLCEQGKVVPVIDKRFSLSDAAVAFQYFGDGHAQGKVVISVRD